MPAAENRNLQVRAASQVRHGDGAEMDVRPRLGQFLKHWLVHRVRLVAEHRAGPANQTGEVIAEQAPACADVHDRRAVADEVVGERSGEVTGSNLTSPDKFHQRAHGGVPEVAANVPWGREDRGRVRQRACGLDVPRGHRSPSLCEPCVTCGRLHTFWNLSLDPFWTFCGKYGFSGNLSICIRIAVTTKGHPRARPSVLTAPSVRESPLSRGGGRFTT